MREMKDSGIEWIGEIPADWNIKRVKAVLCERNESNNPIQTDEILSLTRPCLKNKSCTMGRNM